MIDCTYISGSAGTGKTTLVRDRIAQDPKWGALCSTTGISAVNLGVITINSLLRYFDTDSLADAFTRGFLTKRLRELAQQYDNLVIDEISMMDAEQLDIVYEAVRVVNEYETIKNPIGIVVVGDFCQLPPVKAKWAFKADCWRAFAEKTQRLTTNYRQGDPEFLEALQLIRAGKGPEAAEAFRSLIRWENRLDRDFDGTTIVGKNVAVDRFNWLAFSRLQGESLSIPSTRWGKPRSEWRYIPEVLELKVGAYVMILSNAYLDGRLLYSNGDCGHVIGLDEGGVVAVELARSGEIVSVEKITRENLSDSPLKGHECPRRRDRYVIGSITYCPLRLAYSSTVHKTQSLTLDRVQLDLRDAFVGQPAMCYVALSRCREAKGLVAVGSPELLAKRARMDPEVLPWV
jgi:hypothetical protein